MTAYNKNILTSVYDLDIAANPRHALTREFSYVGEIIAHQRHDTIRITRNFGLLGQSQLDQQLQAMQLTYGTAELHAFLDLAVLDHTRQARYAALNKALCPIAEPRAQRILRNIASPIEGQPIDPRALEMLRAAHIDFLGEIAACAKYSTDAGLRSIPRQLHNLYDPCQNGIPTLTRAERPITLADQVEDVLTLRGLAFGNVTLSRMLCGVEPADKTAKLDALMAAVDQLKGLVIDVGHTLGPD